MSPPAAAPLRFSKMHGAGNDFVILDRRAATAALPAALIERLCDRHRGIGCDQLLTIEPPRSRGAALAYGIWNADGSASGQCGNGARCVVAWARRAGLLDVGEFTLDSPSGPVGATIAADGRIEVTLARPLFEPARIPLRAQPADDYPLLVDGATWHHAALSMGNPHAVFEVADVATAPVAQVCAALAADGRYPEGCNVGFAEVVDRRRIRLRVVERGVGETLACGSGACAAVVALTRRGRLDRGVAVDLPGGTLSVDWAGPEAPVRLGGPTEFVFEGEWPA